MFILHFYILRQNTPRKLEIYLGFVIIDYTQTNQQQEVRENARKRKAKDHP